jgi:hypothetical protein
VFLLNRSTKVGTWANVTESSVFFRQTTWPLTSDTKLARIAKQRNFLYLLYRHKLYASLFSADHVVKFNLSVCKSNLLNVQISTKTFSFCRTFLYVPSNIFNILKVPMKVLEAFFYCIVCFFLRKRVTKCHLWVVISINSSTLVRSCLTSAKLVVSSCPGANVNFFSSSTVGKWARVFCPRQVYRLFLIFEKLNLKGWV